MQQRRLFKQTGCVVPPELQATYQSIAGKLGSAAFVMDSKSRLSDEELAFIDANQWLFSTVQLRCVPNVYMSRAGLVLEGRQQAVFVKQFASRFGVCLRDMLMGMRLLVRESEVCGAITCTKNALSERCMKRRRVGATCCGNHRSQELALMEGESDTDC